eukprot:Blabericola_migrator_1__12582@NODE_7_length_25668_cov_124_338502_g6_i0_p9_GENE_NODE_7_length_25668_cov_124_338502_g6_i0NODE_7_length_25668_cov_124_338502_g6_i0_p9_ORF_typecomplete_len314_score59_70HhHGPD/PF00730_25/2_1e34HHH/PF00633_23/1_5e07CheZ/PF04344_13/0_55CheZ/PF04344_13/2_5e02_NODE_7_length_25668_cov_124_338502_g6_i01489615837
MSELYEQQMRRIRHMRRFRDAPVDLLGTFRCADVAPNVQRFHVLVSLLISSQTRDETVVECMRKLFTHGCTVEIISEMETSAVAALLYPVGFYNNKAKYLKQICDILKSDYPVCDRLSDDTTNIAEGCVTTSVITDVQQQIPSIKEEVSVLSDTNQASFHPPDSVLMTPNQKSMQLNIPLLDSPNKASKKRQTPDIEDLLDDIDLFAAKKIKSDEIPETLTTPLYTRSVTLSVPPPVEHGLTSSFDVPRTYKEVCSLPGIGPKMATLFMELAWDECVGIAVDLHVHRIANRLQWVATKSPEATKRALEMFVPR